MGGFGTIILFTVLVSTLVINFINNRCPNCKLWKFKGFSRVDEEIISDEVKVYCDRCQHRWNIKYKKSDIQPKTDTTTKD